MHIILSLRNPLYKICHSDVRVDHFKKINYSYSSEQLEMIAERSIKEADKDGQGYIVFEEFEEAINEIDVEGEMAFVSFY